MVYLNIYHGNGLVDTKMEKTTIAISEYGELNVISVGEPENVREREDGSKEGFTPIAIENED